MSGIPEYIDSSNLSGPHGTGVTIYLQPETRGGIDLLAQGMREGGAFVGDLSTYDARREAIRYAVEVGLAAIQNAGAFERPEETQSFACEFCGADVDTADGFGHKCNDE